MEGPLVSIITPVFNCEKYLIETIKSVEEQSYTNWEHIIIDDCSSDNTKEIINKYATDDHRVRKIFLQNNSGVANARNYGIEAAKGKYIAFIDADDLWKTDKLMKQITYMEENNCKFSYSNYEIINADSVHLKYVYARDNVNYRQLLNANIIGCLTVIIDSQILKQFKMPVIKHEDYATWLNILRYSIANAENVDGILASYRKLSTSVSSNKIRTLGWTWNIYKNNQKLGMLKSIKQIIVFNFLTIIKHVKPNKKDKSF